jgi:hypothetical protein
MVQLALASLFGCAAVLLLLYGILRLTQSPERPLSPARRASILGGIVGLIAILGLIAWWAWINPPN